MSPRSYHLDWAVSALLGCLGRCLLSFLPKPTPASVIRIEQFCAICVIPLAQFCPFVWFLWVVFSSMVLYLVLLRFFTKCFELVSWSLFLLFLCIVLHLPSWSHLFPKNNKCDGDGVKKERKGRRKKGRKEGNKKFYVFEGVIWKSPIFARRVFNFC